MIEKQLRCLSIFIVICLVFVIDCACISVSAAGQDQGKDMIESYDLDGFQFVFVNEDDGKRLPVKTFDAAESGVFAVASEHSLFQPSDRVTVFSPAGNFKYAWNFSTEQAFFVKLDEDEAVSVYFLRDELKVTLGNNGKIVNAQKLQTYNDRFWRNHLDRRSMNIGDNRYLACSEQSAALLSNATQLVKSNTKNGETVVLYQANAGKVDWSAIFSIGFIVVLFPTIVVKLVKKMDK